MRVWMCDVTIEETCKSLDNQRLIAQHRECAGILGMLAGPQKDRFKNNPLSKIWKDHQAYLVRFHDVVIAEMKLRGWQKTEHATPLDLTKYPSYDGNEESFTPTPEQITADRKDLESRYVEHCQNVLEGLRFDMLMWKVRRIPEWLSDATKDLIIQHQIKLKGKAYNSTYWKEKQFVPVTPKSRSFLETVLETFDCRHGFDYAKLVYNKDEAVAIQGFALGKNFDLEAFKAALPGFEFLPRTTDSRGWAIFDVIPKV